MIVLMISVIFPYTNPYVLVYCECVVYLNKVLRLVKSVFQQSLEILHRMLSLTSSLSTSLKGILCGNYLSSLHSRGLRPFGDFI